MPIVDHYIYLGVEILEECSWDAPIAKVVGKGEAHVDKMDAILPDSHLDTRIEVGILMNVVIKTRICRIWEGNGK